MSILDKEWKLSQQAQEFFVYATLGIVPEEIFNKGNYDDYLPSIQGLEWDYCKYCAFMCAKAAYNDLCRTLEYKDDYKNGGKKVKDKENAINSICISIVQAILKEGQIISDPKSIFSVLFNDNKLNSQNFTDNGLKEYLKKYKSKDKKHESEQKIHFGQVQKWVNMTLKYLYLLGIVNDNSKLQIPIDSYIMKALNQQGVSVPNTAWSRFNYKEYEDLCNLYKDRIDMPYIEWEHDAWIIQAEKEKGIEITDK